MTHRFLIDESVGQTTALHLRATNLDVESVAELMPSALDTDILGYAVSTQRIVVTIDKDFGDLVFRDGLSHAGVILLRLDDDTIPNIVRAVDRVIAEVGPRIAGNFVVVTERHIRVRQTLHR
ncbi:MAG: DUF5615 family PIN-like protein [Caldilinea sp.]|nr:DUF5615 family PIN-like protein [Caldilinea sp.]MCB0056233.1 DUF5615 family PIN-like protein [Caldilineaceae bacterium]MCB0040294.1 DUF5615 family PIN-like protein [Caldilinea sp.]MCB0049756.1 DUF5615 family PIN-like protein [Caldilinea sp.]MCB0066291.1 DUF5615 family PIN-like protein [Caldilineaceae bacterium]